MSAQSLPQKSLSAALNNPSIMLKDAPALSKALPRSGVLTGQPLYHIPGDKHDGDGDKDREDLNPEHLNGTQRHFALLFASPIKSRASFESGPCYDKSSESPGWRGLE